MQKNIKLFQASTIVLFFLALTKLFNFVKYILIGHFLGTGATTDGFFVAFSLPSLINVFTESLLFFTFIPMFAGFLANKQDEEAKNLLGGILGIVSLVSLVVALTLAVAGVKVISFIAPGFSPENKIITARMLRVLSPVIVLGSLAGLFRAVNSVHRRYFISTTGGLVEATIVIGALVILYPVMGIFGLIAGIILGTLVMFLIQIAPSIKEGRWRDLRLGLGHSHLAREWLFMGSILLIWLIHHLIFVVMNAFASNLGPGSVSALYFGRTIAQATSDVLGMTVLISIFPLLVRQARLEKTAEFKSTFFRALGVIILIAVPVSAFLFFNNILVVSAVFKGNSFGIASVRTTSSALAYFSVGIFALGMDQIILQALIALKRMKMAVILTCSKVGMIIILYFLLTPYLGFSGLALAYSTGLIINAVVASFVLKYKLILAGWPEFYNKLFKVILAVVPAVFVFRIILPPATLNLDSARLQLIGRLVLSFSAGCLAYVVTLGFLRVEEAVSGLNYIKIFSKRYARGRLS